MRPQLYFYGNPNAVGWLGWIDYGEWVRFIALDGEVTRAYSSPSKSRKGK